MEFDKDVDRRSTHGSQWAVVLEGRIDMTIGGVRKVYEKGDRYFISVSKSLRKDLCRICGYYI